MMQRYCRLGHEMGHWWPTGQGLANPALGFLLLTAASPLGL